MPLVCVSGERFRFREWYEVRREHVRALRQRLQPLRTGLDWARVPDGLALRFVPPPDVTAALHEAEDLRDVALGDAVRLVAGAGAGARTEAALLAEQIHLELVGAVQDRWLPPQGEQLVVSAPETTRALARSGANILRALYGYKASPETPSVGIDDALFACVHGGAAARFALRHIAVVEAAQARAREWWSDPSASDAKLQFADERTSDNVLERLRARRSFAAVRTPLRRESGRRRAGLWSMASAMLGRGLRKSTPAASNGSTSTRRRARQSAALRASLRSAGDSPRA